MARIESPQVTSSEAVEKLRRLLPGRNLYDLASQHSITIKKDGRKNKGWVGQTIERVADLTINNIQHRDGVDFELKSTTLVRRDERWAPKETIRITSLNPLAILEETFETSALWNKLSRLIFVGCHHVSTSQCLCVAIHQIDITDPKLIQSIRANWEEVRQTISLGEIATYHNVGNSTDYIQLRPTGDGTQTSVCPVTGEKFPARAFYGTKRLIREIFDV